MPELHYLLNLMVFLSLLWTVTLGWFYAKLAIYYALLPVFIWLGLLFLSVLICYFLLYLRRFRLPRGTAVFNAFWLITLSWVMLLNVGLLYQTGGTINPLIHLLLMPLALGMLILSSMYFMVLAGFAAGFYTLLSYFYVPIMSLKVTSLQAFFAWHLHGSMLVFMLLVLLLATLILPLKKRLEAQRAALDAQRNAALQSEYLLSIASIASASAHQLSTPLNTLALLEPLLRHEVHSPLGKAYLQTFSEQVQVCHQALQGLRKRANYGQHPLQEGVFCQALLDELQQEFALIHPKSVLNIHPLSYTASPHSLQQVALRVDASFKLAVMNLLDNAARYSPNYIALDLSFIPPGLVITIEDKGGGVSAAEIAQLGFQPQDAYHGIGMGLFLSRMIIERFSGKLTFSNVSHQGVNGLCARVFLPGTFIIYHHKTGIGNEQTPF